MSLLFASVLTSALARDIPKSAEKFSLRATPVLGAKKTAESGFKMSVEDRSITGKLKAVSEITKLQPDGAFETTTTVLSREFVIDGEKQEPPLPKPTVRAFDKDQNPLGAPQKFDVGDPVSLLSSLMFGHDPTDTKQIGESWKVKSENGVSTFTLTGREKVGIHPCFKISVQAQLAALGASADVTGAIYLRESDRTGEKIVLSTKNYSIKGSNGKVMAVEFWMNRLP